MDTVTVIPCAAACCHSSDQARLPPAPRSSSHCAVADAQNIDLVVFERAKTGQNQPVGQIGGSSVVVVDCRARRKTARDLDVQAGLRGIVSIQNARIHAAVENLSAAGCWLRWQAERLCGNFAHRPSPAPSSQNPDRHSRSIESLLCRGIEVLVRSVVDDRGIGWRDITERSHHLHRRP